MKWDEWIGKTNITQPSNFHTYTLALLELDNHYLKYHADKKKRIEERGEKCFGTAPEAMDGAIELLEELSVTTTPSQNK